MKTIKVSNELFVSVPDAVDQFVTVNKKVWRFEYCSYCGPLWLKKNGKPRKCQVPTSKKVWAAFNAWLESYKKRNSK